MADAQVLAAERNERGSAKSEALGADDGGLDHIKTALQTPIGLQAYAMPQAVDAQRLVGFGKPKLPGSAGIFDRGERACAGTAVVAGNRDEIRVGLGDSGRHRPHARFCHELHRHERVGVHLLEIKDELRQILDRVDVVMRRG